MNPVNPANPQSAASTPGAQQPRRAPRQLVAATVVSGFIAFVLLLLTPLLPVTQVQSSVQWPQGGSVGSVNAPLISLAPQEIDMTVPLEATRHLREGQNIIVSTLPASSEEATDRGMFVSAPDGGLVVSSINKVLFELSPGELAGIGPDKQLRVHITDEQAEISVPGTSFEEVLEDDYRPQLSGLYSELKEESSAQLIDAGLAANIEINSRFTSSPTLVKSLAMWLGLAAMAVSLWGLWRLDQLDGRRIPLFNRRWRTFKPLDAVVLAVLGFWHVFGANTSDDGFLLTMARVSNDSDYMANYYRWYGVPEAPFGSPFYDVLALLAKVTTASMWMRLPTLLAAILVWWLISRELLPRFGAVIADRRMAYWTAAFVFLAFWLPYNNGTRPEPIIAMGLTLTWALFERTIATKRLAPAALGTVVAAFTLACGPTGLAAVGVFLICLPEVFRIMNKRRAIAPGIAYIAAFLAAGFAVMVPVFKDQTLATVLEATKVRGEVGPALSWYSEWVRYGTLFQEAVDGSLSRRFPMLVFAFCVVLILFSMARHGAIPGTPAKPTQRLMLIIGLSTFFLMFTPTKWTHHFGIYAGIGGVVAALGAVVLSHFALQSARNRSFAIAAVLFLVSLSLAGWNAWWYVSSFGVPWWDKNPQVKGIEANTVLLGITLVIALVGVVQWLRPRPDSARERAAASRWAGVMAAPIAVAAVLMVAFSCLTFVKAFAEQTPNYSVGMGNVKTFKGDICALGSEILLETDTNDSFLTPVDGVPLGRSLDSGVNRAFHPDGVPATIADDNADTTDTKSGDDTAIETVQSDANEEPELSSDARSVEGNRPFTLRGVNGSTVRLPFNLDFNRIPLLGTYDERATRTAYLETTWFELPQKRDDAPLLVTSVAGKIAHHDINGVEKEGAELVLEYGVRSDDGSIKTLGETEMLDQGPTPKWRNLRYPIADLPEEANVVRLVAEDASLAEDDWMAVTPLRNPTLQPLNKMFDSDTPGLLDWSVAFQYPCQRTFNHFAGVTEIPEFRIMPDAPGKQQLSGFMDFLGGGALSTAEAVNYSYQVPGYMKGDWQRDWGSLSRYQLRTNSIGEVPALAEIQLEEVTRSGWWTPGPMKIREV